MANFSEIDQYDEYIYQLDTQDPVLGGPDGPSNKQGKALANRTNWLKLRLAELTTAYLAFVQNINTVLNGLGNSATRNVGTVAGTVAEGNDSRFYPIATNEEVQTGTVTNKIVTPAGLESKTATESRKGIAALASEFDLLNGDAEKILTPAVLLSLFDSGFGFSEEFNVFTESESNMSIGSSRLAWFKLGDLAIINIYVRVTITGSVGNQILFQASSSAFNHLIAKAFTTTGGYLALGTSSGINISGIFGIYDLSLVNGGNFAFNVKRSDNSDFPVTTNSEWNFTIAYMTN